MYSIGGVVEDSEKLWRNSINLDSKVSLDPPEWRVCIKNSEFDPFQTKNLRIFAAKKRKIRQF